jgi:FADH2 O2-dependent halogenase
MPRLAWRAASAAGSGWAMLPSAAGFVDPLFSTGFPLTLLGVERLARWLEGGPERPPVDAYADVTLAEADHTARFVAGCYAAFPRFDRFTAYSMFYFAAASFSEMARRLDARTAPAGFLGVHDEAFRAAMMRLSPAQVSESEGYAEAVARAVAPMNIAGLCDASKRNWYEAASQADLKVRLYDLRPTEGPHD